MAAAAAATPAARGAGRGVMAAGTGTGREGGKFFIQLAGPAMGAFGAAPVRGPHEDFAVLPALFTMKFVNWHAENILNPPVNLKPER